MHNIRIDVAKVMDSMNKLNEVKKEINAVRQGVRGTTYYLDSRICRQNDIGMRLEGVQKRLLKAGHKAERISETVFEAIEDYRKAEREGREKIEEL